jgi:hypothetical protein
MLNVASTVSLLLDKKVTNGDKKIEEIVLFRYAMSILG